MTPQRIKEEAEKYTKDEGYQKAYIAGATSVSDKAQGLVDALELAYSKLNFIEDSDARDIIRNALAKWKGEGER